MRINFSDFVKALELACSDLESAVRWAAVIQKQLLEIAWPEVVLEWPMCAEVYDHENNVGGREALLWKGLRVRIGMACGKPQYRKPLNTGTAFDATTDTCSGRSVCVPCHKLVCGQASGFSTCCALRKYGENCRRCPACFCMTIMSSMTREGGLLWQPAQSGSQGGGACTAWTDPGGGLLRVCREHTLELTRPHRAAEAHPHGLQYQRGGGHRAAAVGLLPAQGPQPTGF